MAASPALLLLILPPKGVAFPLVLPTVVSPPLPPPLERSGAAPTSILAANAAARTTSIAPSTSPPFSNSDQPPLRPSPLPALHGLSPLPRARLPQLPRPPRLNARSRRLTPLRLCLQCRPPQLRPLRAVTPRPRSPPRDAPPPSPSP